jgi:hypothetical protein
MATLTNAGIYYESGQAQQVFAAMTANAARTVFTASSKPWSAAAGYEYTVAPYGLATGGVITVGAATGDVAVAALTAYMAGATGASATTGLLSVGAKADLTVTLNTDTTKTFRIDSVTVTTLGAVDLIEGTVHTAFVETRNVAGGPPLVPDGSIEIGQVRRNFAHADTNRAVTSDEIYQVVGTHQERYDYPVWSEDPIRGQITFAAALDAIHVGAIAKRVYVRAATPIFAEIPRARDWVPAETSNSVNSEDYYDGPIGSVSSSLGQASFTVSLNDGVTDALLAKKGDNLLFRFRPDKNKAPYQITQGLLGVSRTFGVGANPSASVTVSASIGSVDFAS